jgi:outer membrane lipoprotein-sorting protein
MLKSFAWGLGLVLVLLIWEYRSLRIGALAFLPLLLTTFLIFGVMGLVGKDFDMPISVLSTLTLGLAIDFAIHFVSRLKARLAEPDAGTLDDALRWTIERPGLGILRNALVFSVGFIVMAFASFTPYITVGVLMAAIMLLSSLATLLCLPAILRAFRRSSPRALGAGLAIALFAIPIHARADQPTADDIVKREQLAYYYPGTDFRAKVTMKLVGKAGDVRERKVSMLRKNLGAAGTDQRYLIFFHKPDDVRRTAFLVWKYPNRDDDRWLFLPAVDLVRRIAASDQRSSFVGSDFTYEDISGRDLAGDTRTLLRSEKLQDADCFVVESKPTGEASYARRITWIDAATFLPRKEEYYDRSNKLFKVFTGDTIQVIAGKPTITLRTMKDVASGHQTTVEMTAVEYDIGIDDDVFSERYLRRPPSRWITE